MAIPPGTAKARGSFVASFVDAGADVLATAGAAVAEAAVAEAAVAEAAVAEAAITDATKNDVAIACW